ncbi:unnamed protein product [Gongylonema pulchrum]|uniref:FBA_2 domain-containing protein n=1 Tax=Gongylonema pulchrum TaxID=637853 RepID=A0A183EUL7_9BILA|nr:unnamed protein product [Gongylonema pulchrum]
MLPANPVPEIIEFWAEKNDKNAGLLTTVESMDFKDWIASRGPLDETKLFKKNNDLLKMCLNKTFLWQDRPQRFTLLGHSGTTLKMTSVLGNDPKNLEEQVKSYVFFIFLVMLSFHEKLAKSKKKHCFCHVIRREKC